MTRLVEDELTVLEELTQPAGREIIELGCGNAQMVRALLRKHPTTRVTAIEIDARQHAKNLLNPAPGLTFIEAGEQAIPQADESHDVAIMLKSLHHVPLDMLDRALNETWRVLRPNGLLYVSEPVFAGPYNEVLRVFHDEQSVRIAALAALKRACASGRWTQVDEVFFEMPISFRDFADYQERMLAKTYVEHHFDDVTLAEVKRRFESNMRADGAHFLRPVRVNLLRKVG